MSEITDKELLEMFRNGDNPNYAFNLLVRKYQRRVYILVRRMLITHEDTNDVVQNSFIKVWKNIGKFREDSQLFSWIYRIATNEALYFLRERNKRPMVTPFDNEFIMNSKVADDNYFKADVIQKKLQIAVMTLPDKQKSVFNLRYYEELSYEEISKITNTTVNSLKSSYHIAVKKIEKILRDDLTL